MATLFNNANIIYIDPSASTNGTGTTVDSPLNAIPVMASLTSNTAYVIRRTSTLLTLQYGTYNTGYYNTYLIGFPRKEDWIYDLMEDDAKFLWGEDQEDYVRLSHSATTNTHMFVWRSNGAGDMGFHRIAIEPPNYNVNQVAANRWWVCGTSSTSETSWQRGVFFTNCIFRQPADNIDDDNLTAITNSAFSSWLVVYGCRNVRFENNKIIYPGRTANSAAVLNSAPFMFTGCYNVKISNIDILTGTEYYWAQDTSANTNNYSTISCMNCNNVVIEDINHEWIVTQVSGNSYIKSAIGVLGNNFSRKLSRIKSRFKRYINEESKPTNLILSRPMIDAWTSGGYAIGPAISDQRPYIIDEDIDVDIYPCWNSNPNNGATVYNPATAPTFTYLLAAGVAYPVVRLVGPYSSAANAFTGVPTDVAAAIAPVAGQLINYPEGYTKNIKVRVPPYIDDGPVVEGHGVFNVSFALMLLSPNALVQSESITNLELYNNWGGALALINKPTNTDINYGTIPPVNLDEVHGGLYLKDAGFVKINKLVCNRAANVFDIQASSLYIDEVVLNATEWLYEVKTFTSLIGSRVVINKINVPVIFDNVFTTITANSKTALIINSEDSTTGKWKGYNLYYFGETSNVYRTGGAPSSIRLRSKSNIRLPLNVGFPGFKNIEITAPDYGKYFLISRFMHSNLATASINALQDYVILFATVFQKVNDQFVKKELNSQLHGVWLTDTSIWNNEEYVRPILNKIPILFESSGNAATLVVSVRLEYDLYDANGRVYFDPAIELVPVTDFSYVTNSNFSDIINAIKANTEDGDTITNLESLDSSNFDQDAINTSFNTSATVVSFTLTNRVFNLLEVLNILKNATTDEDSLTILNALINLEDLTTIFTSVLISLNITKTIN
jgi:hypothetical protein